MKLKSYPPIEENEEIKPIWDSSDKPGILYIQTRSLIPRKQLALYKREWILGVGRHFLC